MPKTAYLAKHFSSSKLKEKYLKSQNSVEMRRWHLLWKISLGWTIKNSAIAVGCSYPYGCGQKSLVIQAIAPKPGDGGIWTGTKVARWIEQETGKEKVWNQRGWDYLKKCGYSLAESKTNT